MAPPKALRCNEQVLGLSLHPSVDIAAVGLISGELQLWKYMEDGNDRLKEDIPLHEESCRVVTFNNDGSRLFSGSADKCVNVLDTDGKVLWKYPEAHDEKVSCLKPIPMNDSPGIFASGDETGEIKLWDARQKCDVLSTSKDQQDYITDMAFVQDKKTLLVTSGDGTLAIYDLKKGLTNYRLRDISTSLGDDFLSLQIIRDGSKVVVGTQEGMLDIFKWDRWETIDDKFPGHPASIESMLKVDESTLCTGSMDGLIRIVNLFPHKLLGVIGDHKEYPIEQLAWTYDRRAIASTSHDQVVRFWDATCLIDDDDDDDDENGNEENEENEESDDSDDEDSDDQDNSRKRKSEPTSLDRRKNKIEKNDNFSAKAKSSGFFSDL